MRAFVNLLSFFVLVLLLTIASTSSAYKPDDSKEKVVVELIEDKKTCKDISVSFPTKLSSCDEMGFADPEVKLEVKKKGETYIKADLLTESANQENYSRSRFCLPDELISLAILTINYEGSVGAVQKADGSILFSVPLCSHTIVVDNLDKMIAQKK